MKKKLKELATLVNGYAFKSINYCDTGIRIIRIANVKDGYVSDESPCYYPLEFEQKLGSAMLKENDLLMSLTGNVGRVALLAKNFLPAGLNQRVECIRPYDNDMTEYLFYYFRSKIFVDEVTSATTGCAQQNLSIKWLENHPIPIYCIKQRTDIVNELKKLDKVIDIKRQQLTSLNNLVKSRFVEMFGDPETNPYNWEKVVLSEIITTINNGMTRRGNDDDGNIVLRLVELQEGRIDYSGVNRIKLKETEQAKFLLKENDFLFARVNGNPDYVGRCAVFTEKDEPIYHNDHIIRVHCKDDIFKGVFGSYLFNSDYGKSQIRQYISTSAGQFTINQTGISSVIVILPPIELQNEFAEFVKLIDKSKFVYLFNPNIFYGSFSRFHHLP